MKKFIEEYVQIRDIVQYFLHYPKKSDTVVIFLHGGPGQSEAQLAYKSMAFQHDITFVYYDQRGAGKTQIKNKQKAKDITLKNMIEDLKYTIQYIKTKYEPKKLILLGHSWGSILGIEYAKKYPQTISALIGMGQVVDFMKGEKIGCQKCKEVAGNRGKTKDVQKLEQIEKTIHIKNYKKPLKNIMKLRVLQSKYKLMGYRDGNIKTTSYFIKSPIFSFKDISAFLTSRKVNENITKELIDYSTANFTSYEVPIFFICGVKDWQAPSVFTDEYFKKISAPKKGIFFIEDAGHLLDIEEPKEFHKTVGEIVSAI